MFDCLYILRGGVLVKTMQADVVIIGGGSAGMSAFQMARKQTDKVLLIEKGTFGTTCAKVGCMPSKLLIAPADARYYAQHSFEAMGLRLPTGGIKVDGQAVMDRVKAERDRFVSFVLETIKSYGKEHLVHGEARFIDDHTVEVNGEIKIKSKSFVIATGSYNRIIPEWQFLQDKICNSDDIFYWDQLPQSAAVIGAGAIGFEIGCALTHLGVSTVILNHSKRIGHITDPQVQKEAHRIFSSMLNLQLDVTPHFTLQGNQVRVSYEREGRIFSKEVEMVITAVGRIPAVDTLGLENTSVSLNDRGEPRVMNVNTMQTTTSHIFIAGDASNEYPLKHVASQQGRIAGYNAASYPQVKSFKLPSRLSIIFTEPQIISVGENYTDLCDDVVIGQVDYGDQGRSRVMLINNGVLRVYVHKKTRRFLGAEGVMPHGEHVAHLLAWSHQSRLTVDQMLDMPFYHPVIEEGVETALKSAYNQLD